MTNGTLKEDVTTTVSGSTGGLQLNGGTYTGTYGTLVVDLNTQTWTYTLNNGNSNVQQLVAGQTVTDTINVGHHPSGVVPFSFNIQGTDDVVVGGGANFLLNGSFETQNAGQGPGVAPTYWSIFGGTGAYDNSARSSDGSKLAVFHGWGTGNGGALSQTITTVVGQTYVLVFDMAEHLTNTNANTAMLEVKVTSGGTTVVDSTVTDTTAVVTSSTGQGYQTYTVTFTATSTSTTIQFVDSSILPNGNTDMDVDNVRVWTAGLSVAENSANGTFVGTAAGLSNAGILGVTYSLTDSAGGRFAINSSTGVITVANGSLLNYDATASHNVTVRATDINGWTYDKVVTIALTNVNEAPVLTLPVSGSNLVSNPSFESGSTGWSGNTGVEISSSPSSYGVSGVPNGSFFVEVEGNSGPANTPSYIQTTVGTTSGQAYEFTLAAVTRASVNVGDIMSIDINGVEVGRFTTTANWADYVVRFTASSASTVVTIKSQGSVSGGWALMNDSAGLLVDNARLFAIPTFTENGSPVVLNASASVTDPELSAANGGNGNFSGATLTLARNGGANSQDVFSATGTLGTLGSASGNVVVGSTTIGTYTNSGGTLVLTFNSSATTTLVNSAMRQIAYSNASDVPPTAVQINWTFNDNNSGSQGSGSALSSTGSTAVGIVAVDDAPVLAAPPNLVSNPSFESGSTGWSGNTGAIERVDNAAASTWFGIPGAADGNYFVEVEGNSGPANTPSYIQTTVGTTSGQAYEFTLAAVTRANVNVGDIMSIDIDGVEVGRFTTTANWADYVVRFTASSTATVVTIKSQGSVSGSWTLMNDGAGLLVDNARLVAIPTFTENGSPVVLNASASVTDPELAAANGGNGNFDGAKLTLQRSGGANSEDVFSATGSLSALTEGSTLSVDGVPIATVVMNSAGMLVLLFKPLATTALVNSALRKIAYRNTSENPGTSVRIDWFFGDGNSGAQGAGTSLTAIASTTVNILASNDPAVITPAVANLTETNAVLGTSGTLAITDVDSATTFTALNNVAGSNGYGTFTVGTNGAWSYTANTAHNEFVAGTTYTDVVTVTSADGTTSTITVNILGTNDAAVITPAVANLTETNAVLGTSGTLAITDVDSATTFTALNNVAGSNGYGTFTVGTDGAWSYTANTAHNEFVAGTTYTDAVTVTSADGTTSTITVNILGTNDAAVITPAVANLTETDAVLGTSGTLAITDVDSATTFTALDNVAGSNGYGTFTVGTDGAWTYTANTAHNEFAAGTTYTDSVVVTSADGTTSTITVNILGTNDAPVGQDVSTSMNEDGFYGLELTYVNSQYGEQAGHPVDAVRIDNIPSSSVGKLVYGANGQVVDAGHNVLTQTEFQTLHFIPNLFSSSLFGLTDVDTGDALGGVRIDTLPNAQNQGRLMLNGQAVVAGATVAAADLGDLTFVPVQHFNGPVTFGFTVQDSHGAYAAAGNTATVNVAAINNAPTIEAPGTTFAYSGGGASGQGKLLTGIQFGDADSGSGDVTVTLSVEGGGRLVASSQSGVVVNASSDGHTITLTGSIENINNLVHRTEGVNYTAAQGGVRYIAPDTAHTTRSSTVTLLPDGRVSFVMTTDAGVMRADESLIPVDSSGAKLITVTGQNTSTLTLVGQQSQLDNYINNLHGVFNDQVAYLHTTISDHGNNGVDPGLSGSSTDERAGVLTSIVIQPLNELPKTDVAPTVSSGAFFGLTGAAATGAAAGVEMQSLVAAPVVQTVAEASAAAAEAAAAAAQAQAALAAALDAQAAAEAASAAAIEAGAANAAELAAAARAAQLESEAALAQAQAAVRALRLAQAAVTIAETAAAGAAAAAADAAATAWAIVAGIGVLLIVGGTILAVELLQAYKTGGGGGTGLAQNNAPVITRPSQISFDEDAQAFKLTGISIADDCAPTDQIKVTFSVGTGTLIADLPSGIFFGSGSTATNVVLFGSIEDINNFLTSGTGLWYAPATNANGTVTLGIDVDDQGHSGWGGSRTTHAETTLQITPVNDAPVAVADVAPPAVEAGGVNNATPGTDPTGNVLSNDTDVDGSGDTKKVTAIGTSNATNNVTADTTSANGTAVVGQYGSLTIGADGTYVYVVDNSNATVDALLTDTLTDSFTYTMKDTAGESSSSTLTVTIHGADDAPVAVADTAAAVEAGGVGNAAPGTDPTGTVLSNDTDVDAGDTKKVKAVGTSSASSDVTADTTSADGTAVVGQYGSLTIGADGTYAYVVDNTNATVDALLTGTLTDTFTYAVTDTAGATSTSTLVVTITGANDAPTVTVATTTPTYTQSTDYTAAHTPVTLAGAATLADVDSGNLSQLVVQLTNRKVGDTLAFTGEQPEWMTLVQSTDGTTITFSGVATTQQYQALLGQISLSNSLPNPDSTARQIAITATDEQGTSSLAASVALAVVSPLDAAIAAFAAAQTASNTAVQGNAADVVSKMQALMVARNNLAQEVHNVLVFSNRQGADLLQAGDSLQAALQKLGIDADYAKGSLSQTDTSILAATSTVLYKQDTGGLVFSDNTQAVLLAAANQVMSETRQDWYGEASRWLTSGVRQSNGSYQWAGTNADKAMAALVGNLYAGTTTVIPGITHTANPSLLQGTEYVPAEGVAEGEPGALATYSTGTLTLTATQLQDVQQHVSLVRLIATNPGATSAQLALMALALVPAYPGTAGLYRADPLLEQLLTNAGIADIDHRLDSAQLNLLPSGTTTATLTVGSVQEWTTVGGQIVFTDATRTDLIGKLNDQIDLQARQLQALQDALETSQANATTGQYTLTQAMVSLLGSLGVSGGATSLSADMRDRVVSQLAALGPLQMRTDGLALSADVASLISLNNARNATPIPLNGDAAISAVTFKPMAATSGVVQLLQDMGVTIDSVQRYAAQGMQGTLDANVLAGKASGSTTVYRNTVGGVDTLFLPQDVFDAVYNALSVEFSQSGTTTGTAYPLNYTAPAVSTAAQVLRDETQPSSLSDVLVATGNTGIVMRQLLDVDTTPDITVGAGGTANAVEMGMSWQSFAQSAADAGFTLVNLGCVADAGAWTTQQQSQFATGGAFAYTADGELVMTPAAVDQLLRHTALAQYFEQRSELAHNAFGSIAQPVPANGLVVVDGTSTSTATTLARDSVDALAAMGLVAVSTESMLELRKLGVPLPAITARGTEFTQNQIDAVRTTGATALFDETDGIYWMRTDARNALLQGASAQMQSLLQLSHLLDPTQPADTVDAATKTAVNNALGSADASGNVQTLALTPQQLTALHLVFAVGTDPSHVSTDALGTVYVVGGNLTMSTATKHWLLMQAGAVAAATFAPSSDATAVASAFVDANRRLQTLDGAMSLGDDQPVVMHSDAAFRTWLQSLPTGTQHSLGTFSDLTHPAGQPPLTPAQVQALFTTIGNYALDGDDIRTSQATVQAWQATAASQAGAATGKGDLFTPASLDANIAAAPAANTTNAAAQFAAPVSLAAARTTTQNAVFAATPDPSTVQSAYLAQITLQDSQLAAIEQELLSQPVPTWARTDTATGADGYGFLINQETLELLGRIDPGLQALGIANLDITSSGDHIISADTRLTLLTYLAGVRETYSPLMSRAVHTNAGATSLLSTLDTAATLVDGDGLVTLGSANATLLQGSAIMQLGATGTFVDTASGHQGLLAAAVGTVQRDASGALHMSLDTLRLLQAEVGGWAQGTVAPKLLTSTQLMAAAAINQLMDGASAVSNQTLLFDAIPGIKVSSTLIDQVASFGLTLQRVGGSSPTAATTAAALADGSAVQLGAYADAGGGQIVISCDTVAWLEQITRSSLQTALGSTDLSTQMPAANLLARWTAEPNYEALMSQLVGSGTALSPADQATYGASSKIFGNALPADVAHPTSTLGLLSAASPNLNGVVVHQVTSPATLGNGDYAVLADGSVVMTPATAALITTALQGADQRELLQESRTLFNTLHNTMSGQGAVPDTALVKINAADLPSYVVDDLSGVDTLKVYTKAEEDAAAAAAAGTPVAAPSHAVSWQTLQSAETAYHTALDAALLATPGLDPATIDFGTLTVGGAVYSVESLHGAYLSLQSIGNAYVQDASGNYFMSGAMRDRIVQSVSTRIETLQHNAALDLTSMLGAATTGTDGNLTVQAGAVQSGTSFKQLLQDLMVTPYYTNVAADVSLTHAVVANADGSFTMSAATRDYLLGQAQLNSATQNDVAIQGALGDLAQAYGVSSQADFIQINNQWVYGNAPLLAHAADDNNPATPTPADKYVVALKIDAALYSALTASGGVFATAAPSALGSTDATRYDSLYTQGNIALDATNHVLYMSADTYVSRLEQLPANEATDLICVDASDFAAQLDRNRDWLSFRVVTSLGGQNSFNDNISLSQALNVQPPGTVFQDSRGMYWMSSATATGFGTALNAAMSVDDSAIAYSTAQALSSQDSTTLATLLPAFADSTVPTANATHYKAYNLTQDQIDKLHSLNINLTQASGLPEWQAPGLGTYVVNGTEHWVGADTFKFLGLELQGLDAGNKALHTVQGTAQASGSPAGRTLLSHETTPDGLQATISTQLDLYNASQAQLNLLRQGLKANTSIPSIYIVPASDTEAITSILNNTAIAPIPNGSTPIDLHNFTQQQREALAMEDGQPQQHVAYDTDGNLLVAVDVYRNLTDTTNTTDFDAVPALPDAVSLASSPTVLSLLQQAGFKSQNTTDDLGHLTNAELQTLNDTNAKTYFTRGDEIYLSDTAFASVFAGEQTDADSEVTRIATLLAENQADWRTRGANGTSTLTGDAAYWSKIIALAGANSTQTTADQLNQFTGDGIAYAVGPANNIIVTDDSADVLLVWALINSQPPSATPLPSIPPSLSSSFARGFYVAATFFRTYNTFGTGFGNWFDSAHPVQLADLLALRQRDFAELVDLRAARDVAASQMKTILGRVDGLLDQKARLVLQARDIVNIGQSLQTDIDNHNGFIASLQAELADFTARQQSWTEIQASLQEIDAAFGAATPDIAAMQTQIARLATQLNAARLRMGDLTANQADVLSRLAATNANLGLVDAPLNELRGQFADEEKKVSEFKVNIDVEQGRLAKLDSLTDQLADFQRMAKDYKARAAYLKSYADIDQTLRFIASYLSILDVYTNFANYAATDDPLLARKYYADGVATTASIMQFVGSLIGNRLLDPDLWVRYTAGEKIVNGVDLVGQLKTPWGPMLGGLGFPFLFKTWDDAIKGLVTSEFEGYTTFLPYWTKLGTGRDGKLLSRDDLERIALDWIGPGSGVAAGMPVQVSNWMTEVDQKHINDFKDKFQKEWAFWQYRRPQFESGDPNLSLRIRLMSFGKAFVPQLAFQASDWATVWAGYEKYQIADQQIQDARALQAAISANVTHLSAMLDEMQRLKLINLTPPVLAAIDRLKANNATVDANIEDLQITQYQTFFSMAGGVSLSVGDFANWGPFPYLLSLLAPKNSKPAPFANKNAPLVANGFLALGQTLLMLGGLGGLFKNARDYTGLVNLAWAPIVKFTVARLVPRGYKEGDPGYNRALWTARGLFVAQILSYFALPALGAGLFRVYNNWNDALAAGGRHLLAVNDLDAEMEQASSLSSATSVEVAQRAKNGSFGNYYEILNASLVENDSSGNPVQAYGALAYHDQGDDLSIAALSTGGVPSITLHLSNTTDAPATYFIRPDADSAVNPYVDVDVSESSAGSTNQFIVQNPHAVIHGGDSLDIYHLSSALDTSANGGYIVDGFGANTGADAVMFDMAQSGQIVHAGAGYNGLVSYRGIYTFFGSAFGDTFTRFGLTADDASVTYVGGGGGNDVFDLRTGDNSVILDGGLGKVVLNGSATPTADTTGNAALYANRMTADNENDVTLIVSDDATQWYEVYGNGLSSDSVMVMPVESLPDQGVDLARRTGPIAGHTDITASGYVLSRYVGGAATSQFGFFDSAVDAFYGTPNADRITLDATSTLKSVDGVDGADTIDVDVAGIEVTGGGAASLVHLRSGATGATVNATAGNAVRVDGASGVTVNAEDNDTDMATSVDLQGAGNATVNAGLGSRTALSQSTGQTATVNIDWLGSDVDFAGELTSVEPDDAGVTTIAGNADSAGTLVVNADDGYLKVQMGGQSGQATQVHMDKQLDDLWVVADQANALFLDLYFDDPAAGSTVTDLQNLAAGMHLHQSAQGSGGMYTFDGAWQHGETSTQISLTFADASKVRLHLDSGATVTLAQVLG
ncbi:MAG TPA: VCBS domain-containing protein [Ramlibacter sp.]|uniref:VCBS domain-containing protein n=1 Tax=Ramlibacter sp. TaxID=1917967 RepID=UPI002CC2527B|nr:VCBS domain-containing protein [Ramlibacter sp.]HVZ45070.1 VCBS domain-containing protein [Ramlibacter sp.]